MVKSKKFLDLSTAIGCKRLFLIFFAAVLLFSFCAQLISSDFGRVKIENISIDKRGAVMSGELYYPAGTSDEDKLPCIVLAHGGAINHNCMRGFAEELSRRGFVVLNLSSYGAGISEQPPYDEIDQGKDKYSVMETPAGLLDMLEYARTLEFVDQTRVGMAGHSMGSGRTGNTAVLDCGWFSINDLKINILFDTFGVEFSEEEIYEDADIIAAEKLSDDELTRYTELAAAAEESYNTSLRSIMVFGAAVQNASSLQTVSVGGHEVVRTCQVNMGVLNGAWDDLSQDYLYPKKDYVKEGWYTKGEDAQTEMWYALDDENQSSSIIGIYNSDDILNNAALKEATDNRNIRVCMIKNETHSRNYFSRQTCREVVYYFTQTMGWNNGELATTTNAVSADSIRFQLRAVLNFLSFLSMIAALFPLLRMLLKSESFGMCAVALKEKKNNLTKRGYIIVGIATIVAMFAVQYYIRINGSAFHKKLNHTFFPLANSSGYQTFFISFLAIFSLVMLIVLCIINRKKNGSSGIESLNLWPNAKTVGKSLLIGFTMLLFAYLCFMLIAYLFNQEFRFLHLEFGAMKADYWFIALRYFLIVFPAVFINGALLNYTVRHDIPQWKDTLIAVIINSAGIYLIFFVNLIIAITSFDGSLFCSFSASHPLLVMVPLTTYISRKMYNLTKSVWVGSTIIAMLLVWASTSLAGIYNYYLGQTWLSIVLGL